MFVAYSLSFGTALLPSGMAVDACGPRGVIAAGFVTVAVCALLAAIARNYPILLIGRVGQGIGCGLIIPAALSMIASFWPRGEERNRALSRYGVALAVGFTLGAVLGGFLASWVSWRWSLLLQTPVALAAALTAVRSVRGQPVIGPHSTRPSQLGRVAILVAAVVTATLALARGSQKGWSSTETYGILLIAVGLVVAYLAVPGHDIFGRRVCVGERTKAIRLAPIVGAGLINASLVGALFSVSIYLRDYLALASDYVGLVLAAFGLSATFGGRGAEWVVRHFGLGHCLIGALGAQTIAAAILVWGSDARTLAVPLVALVVLGGGYSVANVAITIWAIQESDESPYGVLGGVLNTAQQLGGGVGVAIVVVAASFAGTSAGSDGVLGKAVDGAREFQAAMIGSASLAAVAAILVGVTIRAQRN